MSEFEMSASLFLDLNRISVFRSRLASETEEVIMAETLSKKSEYEQMFRTRHRGPGRPADRDGEVLFPAGDADPLLVRVAQRRAFAVVHEEQRSRLTALFVSELKVLRARGVDVVAADIGSVA